MPSLRRTVPSVLVAAGVLLAGCGEAPPAAPSAVRTALDAGESIVVGEGTSSAAGARLADVVRALDAAAPADATLTVDYPQGGSVFPPGFVPPTFLWHDDAPDVDAWLVRLEFAAGAPLLVVVPGPPPEPGWVDRRAIGDTNELYVPTEYQASARSWTPAAAVWETIQARSVEAPVTVTFAGFATDDTTRTLSRGAVHITTSKDPVGAPIFYRDVPLMPSVSKIDGKIQPLPQDAMPLIEWRLRDVTRPESKLLLTGMRKCANCHSFSRDGKRMGMDVDGPTGDKGAYAMLPISKQTVIGDEQVITWNSFEGRIEGTKTIGFLSRVSPDGMYAVTTLNESLYVANFANYRFLQVFYPTAGILAWASVETGEMKALPGADDPDYVHCAPSWLPDGKSLVFCRAKAFRVELDFDTMARYPNDEREPEMHYDLYRMPFDEGRGGTPVPIEGASGNGMSNSFPKVSPDGRWIVFTKCKNAQLMRPDGRLWIVPVEGGVAREMRCNMPVMNSWHSFSPNGRWLCFTSKSNTPYTQLFLTHLDEDGNDTPAILVPNCTASNRAVNLPEFLNASIEAIDDISVPAVDHDPYAAYFEQGTRLLTEGHYEHAVKLFERAVSHNPDAVAGRVNFAMALRGWGRMTRSLEQYECALEIEPSNPLASGAAGLLDGAEDGLPDVAALRAAVAAKPEETSRHRALALALARVGALDEAAGALGYVLERAPEDVDVRRALAFVLLCRREDRAAAAQLQWVASRTEKPARLHAVLAWLHATSPDPAIRNPELAVQNGRIACRLTEYQDVDAVEALAAGYASAGNRADAVETARLAVRLAERDRPGLVRWAQARLEQYEGGGRPGD